MKTKHYPLSDSQKGIYYEWEKDKSLTQYNITFLYEFPETTDPVRLKSAFEKTVNAHPNMKLRLRLEGEEVVQYYDEDDPVEISMKYVSESEMKVLMPGFRRPFDLLGSPLYRIELYLTGKKLYAVFDNHHINFDGVSAGIFDRDLAKAYGGVELTKESFTGCDYAEAERSCEVDEKYLEDEAYFEKRLSGITMTRVPTMNNKETEVGYMQSVSVFIDQHPVSDFCTGLKISPNNLFAGALGICLNRYTREPEIAFCTTHHGRLDERLKNSVGMFVRTLPVTMKLSPEQPVSDFLSTIRADLKELYSRQVFPFSEMVKKFGASVEIIYTYQQGYAGSIDMDGHQVNSIYIEGAKTTDKLVVYIFPTPDNYEIRCEYNDSLYQHGYMKAFASAIKNAVMNMVANANRACGDISILSTEQEEEIIRISAGECLDHNRSLSLVDLFRRQVQKTPERTAVVFRDRKLTYRELDLVTDRIAKKLRTLGVCREKVVGVMIDRSEYLVIYPLSVMKAGGAYMPLDYTLPSERLDFMVKDAGAGHVLSEGSRVAVSLPGFAGAVINTEDIPALEADDATDLPKPAPEDMYVLLYTSGSTGTPKGCILEHRNIVNFCRWYVKDFDITQGDRGSAYASFSFDCHMLDIYPMITTGASVYVIPSEMRMDLIRLNQYMEENGLTVSFMTTQVGRQFAEDIENKSLRLLSVAGERLMPTKKPPYRFYNAYGPTECTIYSTFYNIERDYDSPLIGHSVGNVSNYIMDGNLQLLPVGVAGELCIGGEAVGRGYLNRDDLNREKFRTWKGQKLYRTGDLARYNEDGEIEYIGRLDNQVKLRGLRIELGEIENAISVFEGVSSAVVDVKEIGGVQHLCGYFTSKTSLDTGLLMDYLRTVLPEFMVPTALVQLDKFPLTNNGKVNRNILPAPQIRKDEMVAPQTEMERHLFEIVSDMLKTRDWGINTNLFSLGMTSVLAIKLSVAIRKNLGIAIQTKDILKLKTIRLLAEIGEQSESSGIEQPLHASEKKEYYPLTENQMGLYYEWEKNRNALQYNIAAALRFSGKVDIKKMKEAVVAVIEAHPYLKTTLAIKGNEIVQLRRDDMPVEIFSDRTDEAKMEPVISSFVRPFNLFGDTLYHFAIYQTESNIYLLFDFHHIVFDGISMGILLHDLKAAFEGRSLEPEHFSAFDNALEEKALTRSEKYLEAEAYFDKLVGRSSMTVFPSSAQVLSKGTAKEVKMIIPAGEIGDFCRKNAITESNFFLAVFCLLLSRYTREDQVVITTVSSGRSDNMLSNLIGMLVKTLPVVVTIRQQTVAELAKSIQDQVFTTIDRDIFPFTKMSEKYGLVPQINFTYEGGIDTELHLGDECARLRFLNLDTVKFPFGAVIFPDQGGYTLTLEFDDALYHENHVRRFAEIFAETAHRMSKNAGKPVSEITLVSDDEKMKILGMSKGRNLDYDKSLTFIDIFRKQAQKYRGKKAVVDEISHLSHEELDRRSDILSQKLALMGVEPDTFVAVMLPRRKEFVVSVLAVMKAGGAYVPLDSEYPNERLLYMLADSESRVFITERKVFEEKQEAGGFEISNVLFVDEFDFDKASGDRALSDQAVLAAPEPENLAYMIYTSGSTGKPKGVMITHKSLAAFLAWMINDFEVRDKDNICCHSSFSFDASIIDLFVPLSVGATTHIISSCLRQNVVELHEYFIKNEITGGVFSTQFGMELLDQFELPLRYIMIGGEKMLPVKKRKLKIYNGYGPTEFTVCSNYHLVGQDVDTDNIPIGLPVPNSWSYVLDANRQLVPQGMAGELCLSGIQVAGGYWKREDLTTGKFIENPYATCPENKIMYCTGDLVRWNDHAELEFIGRIDNQIKLRGYRIELGEIESVIKKFSGVAAAVVDVREFGGVRHLCGYYTAESDVDPDKLLKHLKSSLAEYMVPTALTRLPSLPLTPNGKVNLKALPMPELARTVEYVAPVTDVEKKICRVYADILGVGKVGVLDNFFEIGGSSMSAIRAIIQIINLGYQINYGDLFKLKTPQAVAAFLSENEAESDQRAQELPEDISGYDYSAINGILGAEKPDLWENYAEYPLGDMLLTGATGYLGIHILKELIEKETGKIYCMVRSKGTLTPERRLKTQLMYYFSDTFDPLFGTRIHPVNGDITQIKSLNALRHMGVNTVINCAACVKHYSAGDELDEINVAGVANLIDYCRGEGARLVHISTMSTGGIIEKEKLEKGILMNESKLFIGQKIENKYVLSKFKAERLLLHAVSEGLDGKIMRVGNLMGRHSDGEFQINFRSNAFINTLKAYKVLRMFPLSQLVARVEISPVDCAAQAVVSLSRVPAGITIAHAYNNYRLDMANVIYAMKQYGFEIDLVSDKIFHERFRQVMQDPRKSEYMSGLLHYRIGDDFVAVPDENDYTTTLLYRNGFRWPLPGDDYSFRLIGLLDAMGFFDEN